MAYPYTDYTTNPYIYNPFKPVSYTPPVNVIWITNDMEASNYPIGPNSAVVLWNTTNNKIYLKKADATGQPILERLWSGDASAFGRLFMAVQEKDSSVRSYSDFFNFFKNDVKVVLKTETTNYQGKQHHKNIIQRIL